MFPLVRRHTMRNGAGKTTTIRLLLGLLRVGGGEISLLGGDPWRDAVALHRLAYVPGDVTLWPALNDVTCSPGGADHRAGLGPRSAKGGHLPSTHPRGDVPAAVRPGGRVVTVWRYGLWTALIAGLMSVFVVVRHTRGDEEAVRMELLAALQHRDIQP
jgi:hypothetical protein